MRASICWCFLLASLERCEPVWRARACLLHVRAGETFRRLEAPSQEILADECMVLSELSVPASEHSTPERDSTAMMSVEEEAETAVEQEDVAEEVDAVPALACPRPESTCLHAPAARAFSPLVQPSPPVCS